MCLNRFGFMVPRAGCGGAEHVSELPINMGEQTDQCCFGGAQQWVCLFFPGGQEQHALCDETEACSHQFGGKSLQQQSLTDNPTAKITFEFGRQFVCEGFDGKIYFSLYDVTGKQIQQGIIQNGELSSLKVSKGLYFIQAKDAAGNQVVKKVVVTN